MQLSILFVLLLLSLASADTVTQTDWSGGPGMPGPVSTWGSDYDCDSGMSGVRTTGSIGLHLGSVPPTFQTMSSSFDGAFWMCPFDVNLDGYTDILCPGLQEDQVTWWQNQSWTTPPYIRRIVDDSVNGPDGETAADFDLDGDIDIAAAVFYDDLFALYTNDDGAGTEWTKLILDSGIWGPRAVSAADLNGDGLIDIAASADQPPEYFVWINTGGAPPWPFYSVSPEYLSASSLGTGDIDGDGDIDIMGTMDGGGGIEGVVWFENTDGSGTYWTAHEIETEFQNVSSGSLADVDGDGDLDVTGCNQSPQSVVAWWENADGQGAAWTRHTIATGLYQPCSEWAADMDGDLDTDVVATSTSARVVCWWQNADGRGTDWIEHFAGTEIYTPWDVISADLDGNGSHEFPLGLEHSIRIYSAVGPSTNGWMESSVLYLGYDPEWGDLSWTADVPADASLGVQVRASDDPGNLGEWSVTLTEPGSLAGLLQEGADYLQYRLVMTAGPSGLQPEMHEIAFGYDPTGLEGGDAPSEPEITLPSNPVRGIVSVEFGLPGVCETSLTVFDISGRLVQRIAPEEYQPGWHTVQLGELGPGVYFVRMTAGESSAAERFAVIR